MSDTPNRSGELACHICGEPVDANEAAREVRWFETDAGEELPGCREHTGRVADLACAELEAQR
jgi:hypothetical protein